MAQTMCPWQKTWPNQLRPYSKDCPPKVRACMWQSRRQGACSEMTWPWRDSSQRQRCSLRRTPLSTSTSRSPDFSRVLVGTPRKRQTSLKMVLSVASWTSFSQLPRTIFSKIWELRERQKYKFHCKKKSQSLNHQYKENHQ